MARGVAAKAARGTSESRSEAHGRAYALGWCCFLAFVALAPLVIGALPSQAGPLALFRAWDPVSLPKVVVLLVLSGLSLVALCVSVARGESELRWHPVLWVLVALVGWAGVSALFAASPAVSVWGIYLRNEGLVAIFGYGLVAFLAVQYVRSTGNLRTVMVVAVVSGSLVSVYALLQFLGIDPIEWSQMWRVTSSFGNADMLGDYLVFPFALSLGLAVSARGRWRSLGWWAATVLITLALTATETRGAWIAVFVLVICMVWGGWRRLQHASRGQKLAFGVLAAALTVAASAAVIVLVLRGPAGGSETLWSFAVRASNGRTMIWLIGLRAWLVHPIIGWGPDGFMRAFESAVGADWYATLSNAGVGFGSADNAHNFLIQALVTLGIPGLALTAWALVRTAIESYGGLRTAQGRSRLLLVSLWGALIGMMVALTFGVTTPEVSVWLWLTVGLLLAPASHRVPVVPRAVLATGAALGVAIALWAGSWLVADVIVGRAMQQEVGPDQVSTLQSAARLNPLSPRYQWFVGEALVNEALAEQRAGQSRQTVDGTMLRAITAYYSAAAADRGDVLVRIALANVLAGYAANHPESDTAQRSVDVALEAVSIGPRDAAALVVLARAYDVAGRHDDANKTARLAREVAPVYAGQTLGSLGLDSAAP